jgi:predicted Rossmann-fold nucleotide-binding protein
VLLGTIKNGDEEAKNNANRLRKILAVKNMAEYEERLMRRAEAEIMMKDTERFMAFVESQLPER